MNKARRHVQRKRRRNVRAMIRHIDLLLSYSPRARQRAQSYDPFDEYTQPVDPFEPTRGRSWS